MKKNINLKQEILAGITSFFAISYVIIVNSMILAEGGIPPELSVFGTIFISLIGSVLIGLVADVPIVLTTGMGVNSFFIYTLIFSLKLTWQQALAVSFCASGVYLIVAYTPLLDLLIAVVPDTLKHGITAGIGLFLVGVGLEKGGLIGRGEQTFMMLNDMASPEVLLTLFALFLTLFLIFKQVPGSFFIGIVATTLLANLLGIVDVADSLFSLSELKNYPQLLGKLDFSSFFTTEFLLGTFSLSMILIFESMGIFNGLLPNLEAKDFKKTFRLNGIIMLFSSLLGTSPTIPAAESSAGIQEGGKTGRTAIVAGMGFLAALFAIPLLSYIPSSALAPVIIITGANMLSQLQFIDFNELSEWLPVFLMVVIMGYSMSISDGLAFGFVSYPLLKVFANQKEKISKPLWVISFCFLLYLVFKV